MADFQTGIVEGIHIAARAEEPTHAVAEVSVVAGRGYLNFGPDIRTDFTVTIAPTDRRGFERRSSPQPQAQAPPPRASR